MSGASKNFRGAASSAAKHTGTSGVRDRGGKVYVRGEGFVSWNDIKKSVNASFDKWVNGRGGLQAGKGRFAQ